MLKAHTDLCGPHGSHLETQPLNISNWPWTFV